MVHDAKAASRRRPAGCGVVLVAGTGSIAYGRDARGREGRAGGWGYLVGDEGSVVWIGTEGLRAASYDADGRGPSTLVTARLLEELGVADFQDVLPFLYGRPHPAPAIVAAARAVARASAEGDTVAARIIEQGTGSRRWRRSSRGRSTSRTGGVIAGGAFPQVRALGPALRAETGVATATVEPHENRRSAQPGSRRRSRGM